MTERNTHIIGWFLYGLLWVLLIANIINDWVTQRWISPLSFLILAILAGGIFLQRFGVLSLVSTKGIRDPRVLLTYGLIALFLIVLVIYLVVSGV